MAGCIDHDLNPPYKAQSVDEYARSNGLTVDSVLDTTKVLSAVSHLLQLSGSIEDGDCLRPFRLPPLSLHELPQVSKASVALLNQFQYREDISALHDTFLNNLRHASRVTRLGLPLLQTDIETDCLELERGIRIKREADIRANPPPAEPLDISHDEALEFPESAYVLHQDLSKALLADRITISKAAVSYLKDTMRFTSEGTNTATTWELTTSNPTRQQKITPPLSPIMPQDVYFAPESSVSQVPLSSDPSTLLEADLDAAQKDILKDEPPIALTGSPRLSPIEEVSVLESGLPRAKSIKLEGPLMTLEELPTRFLNFEQVVADLEPGTIDHNLDSHPRKDLNDMLSDDLITTFRDAAVSSVQSIEQEQLEAADAVARLLVLDMDFTIPEVEWRAGDPDARKIFEVIMLSCGKASMPIWPVDRKAELQMQWIPFSTKLGKVSLDEAIEKKDSHCLLDFEEFQYITDSSAYVWKKPGLAILHDPDDEELSEPDQKRVMPMESHVKSSQHNDKDLDALVKERKLKLDTTISSDTTSALTDLELTPTPILPLCPSKHILVGVDDPSASSTLLENFVSFHAPKRRKLGESPFFSKSRSQVLASIKTNARRPDKEGLQKENISASPRTTSIYAPYPKLKPEGVSPNIITALTLPRGVTTWLEKLLPLMNITERDFDRWNTVAWDRKSVSRSPIISSLAAEADVIVSPSTGIVITSFIRAIQRPLPGQKGKAAIRDRIEKVSRRYERMIILVSEANRIDESARNLSDAECAAFSEFSGFVNGLDTDTQVYYVGGGEETLSRWLAYLITRYSYEAPGMDTVLIETETTWELFLRRAGMNAFAAQIVLSTLKEARGSPQKGVTRQGLAEFVSMPPAKRISEFRHILGGERVLRRVSTVLDFSWD